MNSNEQRMSVVPFLSLLLGHCSPTKAAFQAFSLCDNVDSRHIMFEEYPVALAHAFSTYCVDIIDTVRAAGTTARPLIIITGGEYGVV